jgi:hypothetical protein
LLVFSNKLPFHCFEFIHWFVLCLTIPGMRYIKKTRSYMLHLLITIFQNSVTQCLTVDHDFDGGVDVIVWQPCVSQGQSSGCLAGSAR